jgi:DNA-binding transcriptional MerR regulator
MPTDQKQDSAPSRETWIDWVPAEGREEALLDAEPLLTRDELVTELRQGGEDVTARDLIHWQTRGVIPYPDRRRHRGATRGVYPQWMTRTIHMLRSLQGQGYTLREIGPLLRGDLYHRFMPQALTPRQEDEQARRIAKRALFPLVNELDPRIRAFARIHERLHGGRITHAEVRLIDDQGKHHTYHFFAGDEEDHLAEVVVGGSCIV